ncbi:GntR family transcriptional regulator [Leifsonia sp. AG29]|uniref:GntR family transcriptional regulator n=1 Tax=Leifsonia sp. AG29 TaxID=2598860 RepID=UPI00131B5063|nr:GntR family transcriptional regulator [Leifsonia sp. AG29]
MPVPGAPELQPVRVLARDRAYEALKTAILERTILPGERLDDGELQAWLGMSKTPIRQALHALTVEGLVETAAQSYTRVIEPRPEDAVLHLQTIGVFVIGVFDLTIGVLSEDDRDGLLAEIDALIDALRTEEIEGSLRASQVFYEHLMRLCPNRALIRLAQRSLSARAYYVGVAYRALGIQWQEAVDSYSMLREALGAGDAETVSAAAGQVFRIDMPQLTRRGAS